MLYTGNAQQIHAYLANAVNSCTVCGGTKHCLYASRKFHRCHTTQHLALVQRSQLCFDCLKSGPIKQQCPSLQRWQECQRPHYLLLHLNSDRDAPSTTAGRQTPPRSCSPLAVTSEPLTLHLHVANHQGCQGQVLLTICQVLVMTPEGTTMQARALLDWVSLTSFIMECLAVNLYVWLTTL